MTEVSRLRELQRRLSARGVGSFDLDRAISQCIAEARRAGVTSVEVPGDGVLVLGDKDLWYRGRTKADLT